LGIFQNFQLGPLEGIAGSAAKHERRSRQDRTGAPQ
jgi:hypothetical protein